MEERTASEQIDNIVTINAGWKGQLITELRTIILSADPEIIEEVKWKMPSLPEGRPVWSHNGIVCIAEIFKNDVKLVFFKGAMLSDPSKLFNARLMSKTDRAIEFREGYSINEPALKALIVEAVQVNEAKAK